MIEVLVFIKLSELPSFRTVCDFIIRQSIRIYTKAFFTVFYIKCKGFITLKVYKIIEQIFVFKIGLISFVYFI